MHLSMLCPRGGEPRDRVGTLIRNKNLESNFLTLRDKISIQSSPPGEGFEFNAQYKRMTFVGEELFFLQGEMVNRASGLRAFIRRESYPSKWVNPSWRAKITRVYKQKFTGSVTLQPATT